VSVGCGSAVGGDSIGSVGVDALGFGTAVGAGFRGHPEIVYAYEQAAQYRGTPRCGLTTGLETNLVLAAGVARNGEVARFARSPTSGGEE